MIEFKNLRFKNFLSYGNQETEIKLNDNTPTCIIGKSGSGKSTIIDALTFVLFGKAHRNITKSQLVNPLNNKNCLVEVDFSVRGKEYLVRRGMRPNVFEIFQNGSKIDQDAASKDYQNKLEEDILQMNAKSFRQLVVISSTDYTPFMEFSAPMRREFIEDILDLKVFSQMREILKEKISANNDDINHKKYEISNIESIIKVCKEQTKKQENTNKESIDELNEFIQKSEREAEEQEVVLKKVEKEYNELTSRIKEFKDEKYLSEAKKNRQNIAFKLKEIKKVIDWFNTTEVCPTCSQHITEEHKKEIIDSTTTTGKKYYDTIIKADGIIKGKEDEWEEIKEYNRKVKNDVADIREKIAEIKQSIRSKKENAESLRRKINTLSITKKEDKPSIDIEEYTEKLSSHGKQLDKYEEKKQYYNIAQSMLKDDGIKSVIIERFIPFINRNVNEYLEKLEMFVNFNVDNEFNEVIKSRGRDTFSYNSFSKGEQARIDVSLLFTFREIAKLRAKASCNLLILDETLYPLDNASCDNIIEILREMKSSIFVISHDNKLIERFDKDILVEKKDNYSILTYSEN